MRKKLLIISLLAVLLIAASSSYTKLYRLTIINKSGMEMAISLLGEDDSHQYYLRVPEGDRRSPTETIFTIVPDTYSINAYYIEPCLRLHLQRPWGENIRSGTQHPPHLYGMQLYAPQWR